MLSAKMLEDRSCSGPEVLLRSSSGPLIDGLLAPGLVSWSFYGFLIVVTSPVDPKALIIEFLMCE